MVDERSQPDLLLEQACERMAATRTIDEVVSVLRRTARRIVGSDGIAVVLQDGDRCHYVAEDAIEPLWMGSRFPLEACISGWAMLNDETVVVPDIGLDPRVPAAPYRAKSMRSLVMVPIGSPVPIAALGAYWCALVLLDAATVSRVEALARHAADAIARIQTGSLMAVDAGPIVSAAFRQDGPR